MAEHNVVTIGTIETISARAGTVLFLAFILVPELLNKPILVDISRQGCRVFPCLQSDERKPYHVMSIANTHCFLLGRGNLHHFSFILFVIIGGELYDSNINRTILQFPHFENHQIIVALARKRQSGLRDDAGYVEFDIILVILDLRGA